MKKFKKNVLISLQEIKEIMSYSAGCPIFKISCETTFEKDEIFDFMKLTGFKIEDAEKHLKILNRNGINNLSDVNKLVAMGYLFNEK